MLKTYHFNSVLYLPKRYPLNLNHYRNAHYRVNHKAKVEFAKQMIPMVQDLPQLDKIKLTYVVYFAQKRGDVANVGSIADKFFCDVLVEAKKITDDDYKHIPEVTYKYGGISKPPRIEVIIEQLD